MGHDGKVDGAVLSFDHIGPDFRIPIGVPAGGYVLSSAGRSDENAVGAKRFRVASRFHAFFGGQRPGAGEDGQLALRFLHRDFQHAAFLGPR